MGKWWLKKHSKVEKEQPKKPVKPKKEVKHDG